MAQFQFDSNQYEPLGDFQPIPEGMYHVICVNSEIKPTKDGNGSYIELQFKVQGGDYDGRLLFERLNLWNQNEVAVDIANKTLTSICLVTGVSQFNDTNQLHGIPFTIYVTVQPAKGEYGPSNNIKGYYDVNGIKSSDIRKASTSSGPGGAPQPPQGPGGAQQPPQPPAQQYQQPPVQQQQPPQAPPQQVVQHQQQPPAPGYQGPQGAQYENPTPANGQTQPSQPQNAAPGAVPPAGTSAPGATAAPGSGQAPQGSPTPNAQPASNAQPAAPQGQPGGNAPWQN
ncbi:MAG: DUF669 domain-containing protein [Synergistaceae bacterium]